MPVIDGLILKYTLIDDNGIFERRRNNRKNKTSTHVFRANLFQVQCDFSTANDDFAPKTRRSPNADRDDDDDTATEKRAT